MTSDVVLPRRARALFATLVDADPVAAEVLHAQIDEWDARVDDAASAREFFDASLARALSAVARALVDHVAHRDEGDRRRRLVQAGVRYLVLTDDAEHDLTSMLGLDDDADVLDAVARAVGREDLVVSR